MESTRVIVKETAVSSVELVQSIDSVLTCVTMNYVQQHHYTTAMSLVYQRFQLIRRSIPTTQHHVTTYILHHLTTSTNCAKCKQSLGQLMQGGYVV